MALPADVLKQFLAVNRQLRVVARHERQLALMRRALDQTAKARRFLHENRRHFDQLHRLHDEALRRGEPDPACTGVRAHALPSRRTGERRPAGHRRVRAPSRAGPDGLGEPPGRRPPSHREGGRR